MLRCPSTSSGHVHLCPELVEGLFVIAKLVLGSDLLFGYNYLILVLKPNSRAIPQFSP